MNKDKRDSDDVRKSSVFVLLSMAAKLRVVAERDLCQKSKNTVLIQVLTGSHIGKQSMHLTTSGFRFEKKKTKLEDNLFTCLPIFVFKLEMEGEKKKKIVSDL